MFLEQKQEKGFIAEWKVDELERNPKERYVLLRL